MELSIDISAFDKRVDKETGSILFSRRGFHGIPDRVLHGEGFTIELQGQEIVLVDIYDPSFIMSKVIDEALEAAGT
jgi:hypothetical protein